ncbi:UPS-like protein C36.10 isoform X2 [Salvia miltiorrhiza]|uniref:UPS-like protein C36.10 isoform X2 n=1 Tax=Salvia miltiorrhiza TaxID=226208 RepID=UPI0025AD8707|nr:UPS-like protein C36.10 isoform X2 [Salvia miltiorrhiza]
MQLVAFASTSDCLNLFLAAAYILLCPRTYCEHDDTRICLEVDPWLCLALSNYYFVRIALRMVRAYSQEHTYKHPWERVTAASWRKFADPENKRTLSHIVEVDTLSHKLERSSGKLYTTRAITVHAPGPWFLRKMIGQDICHCVESTVVDAQARSMQLATRNISLEKFLEVEEKIRYDPHPEDPVGWTICRQETRITIKPLSALATMAEKIEQKCVEKFQHNSAKGREVMERICKYLEAESRGISA